MRLPHALLLAALLTIGVDIGLGNAMAATPSEAMQAEAEGKFDTAFRIWNELADAGDDRAAISGGLLAYQGRGRAPNYEDAYTMFLKAFPKSGDAWNNIGVMFREGQGVPKNRKVAYLMFLAVHMNGIGGEATVMRANRNLRREQAELSAEEKQLALCYTGAYLTAYIRSRGKLEGIPEALSPSPERKRIRDLGWFMKGELEPFDCPTP